jgi:thiamine biosynthesis protein ThiS
MLREMVHQLTITVNGEARDVVPGLTVAALVAELGLEPRYVAVECNDALLPRARHAQRRIEAGDRLEIVTLVGGG